MKFVYKGKMRSMEELPKGTLPENAVKFKEPENMVQMNIMASLFVLPIIIVICLFVVFKSVLRGNETMVHTNLWGVLLAFLCIVPHEFLHAICFPKGAEVEMYYTLKGMAAFVVSTYPVTKLRFIMLSLCPSIVLGILPLILWLLVPSTLAFSQVLFSFGAFSLLFGCGDLMNVFNALKQMPKGSYQQLSGFNSYWFMP